MALIENAGTKWLYLCVTILFSNIDQDTYICIAARIDLENIMTSEKKNRPYIMGFHLWEMST